VLAPPGRAIESVPRPLDDTESAALDNETGVVVAPALASISPLVIPPVPLNCNSPAADRCVSDDAVLFTAKPLAPKA
jgi:hypothetical protein